MRKVIYFLVGALIGLVISFTIYELTSPEATLFRANDPKAVSAVIDAEAHVCQCRCVIEEPSKNGMIIRPPMVMFVPERTGIIARPPMEIVLPEPIMGTQEK